MMISSPRILIINIILILLIHQVHSGYWVCDWVNGRGWMYCARGFCNTYYGRKRSISMEDKQISPVQDTNGLYCLDKKFCYSCEPINDSACHITLRAGYSPSFEPYSLNKRAYENTCD
ncbi:unnamed protein product [Adineta steineri]|uniref:Secreted protein n=1 Tax=Adineta steineri TaxID=433720 RepID=A0A818IXS2_9BILA|nr:unnamed protein product [Adineta steineri]CAF0786855.1 unnamed protein product [Adineta steineri]CAF0803560.1 unnamed protein product [Adineta steineri]CAF0814974.1 unnamed protein product [Adineta steineri]CAF0926693.1 unnamed protein product [Adineta steineri]